MNIKTLINTGLKWLGLSIIMFVIWMIGIMVISGILGITNTSNQESQSILFITMLMTCLINTAVIMYPVIRSKWYGLKLISVVFLQIFGIQFFISTGLETLFFNDMIKMQLNMILMMNLAGLILASLFSPIAVIVLGKMKNKDNYESGAPISMSWKEFLIKLAVLALIIYPILYFVFGYFIAWQYEDVRLLYSGSKEILPFFKHMREVLTNTYTLPFQMFRGVLWVLIVLPVIRMMKGKAWEKALACGLLLSMLMNSQHLMPNEYFNDSVRLAHFLETASSNFIWGALIGWIMGEHHDSIIDLFKKKEAINL
jgi:hypothetical protein